jgi:tungstate transport system ATP-binding protein
VDHLTARKARGLSGGEASRVALARAFATEPALLLLDEPFSALDAPSRTALLPSLREQLRETGTAATLVTHDLQEAAAFSDRLAVMVAGRIVASGRALDLMGRPPSREVAELLGIENILPGEIVGREGGHVCVALQPGGPTVRIALGSERTNLLADRVTVTLPAAAGRVLRTEQPVPPEWNRVTGVVREVQWLASGARLIVETPALVAALAPWDPTASPWSVGERAVVMFAPEAAHLIPEAR